MMRKAIAAAGVAALSLSARPSVRLPPCDPGNAGLTLPEGFCAVVVADQVGTARHLVVAADGKTLFVNVGSPSNACQLSDRSNESPGKDPCPELATRAGIWRFDAAQPGQTEASGTRYATGIRNAVGMTLAPDGQLWSTQHGRDQLGQNWSKLFTNEQSAEKPSGELLRVNQGDDFGWPYCYHDLELGHLVLAPEYGGDGKQVGRCAQKKEPAVAFPGHWAPDGLTFYAGTQFPERYRGGAFIAFHGSWNRAPLPQAGLRVGVVSVKNGQPVGGHQTVAHRGWAGKGARAPHPPRGTGPGAGGAGEVPGRAGGGGVGGVIERRGGR